MLEQPIAGFADGRAVTLRDGLDEIAPTGPKDCRVQVDNLFLYLLGGREIPDLDVDINLVAPCVEFAGVDASKNPGLLQRLGKLSGILQVVVHQPVTNTGKVRIELGHPQGLLLTA